MSVDLEIIDGIGPMRARSRAWAAAGQRVGLVPTMGALHEGHLSLVRASAAECDRTVVSIFVNPTQFAPGEDLERYPRDLEGDAAMLAPLGADAIFTVAADAMYPKGYETYVVQETLFGPLCGLFREGHFRGVATVVSKLFNVVEPKVAYFGRKDAQQCVVIERLVEDLNFDVSLRFLATVREPDGLAMSSRNAYLSPEDRERATALYRALSRAREEFEAGERRVAPLLAAMDEVLESVPGLGLEYREIVDPRSLVALERIESRALCAIAARVGASRLIDNVILGEPDP